MVVLVDGVYEEEYNTNAGSLGGGGGVGGTIGGKFIGFSVGGPPCERRTVTLGVSTAGPGGNSVAGGGFGWVDFLGVGSERALGSRMRKVEQRMLKRGFSSTDEPSQGRGKMIVLGEVNLDSPKTLEALKKVLGTYAAASAHEAPMSIVLIGNFMQHAVMAGGGSGGSIEYKECFDALASTLSDFPSLLQSTTFIFVPGDNDPWASAFSAGTATVLPRKGVPELFTSRVKRAFATANAEADRTVRKEGGGEAIWTTNPSRLSLFGPAHEIVFFRDDMSGRLRRNALRFSASTEQEVEEEVAVTEPAVTQTNASNAMDSQDNAESMDVDLAVQTAESQVPSAKGGTDAAHATDMHAARKLVKTLLDQGYLSPFPLATRPVLWDYAGALQLYPLPSTLVLVDLDAPPFVLTYEGCHVVNPGPLLAPGRRGVAVWAEYDAGERRGKIREMDF